MMDKESNKVSFWALECSTKQHDKQLREMMIEFSFTQEGLGMSTIVNLIHQSFQLRTKKIILYDWKGIEITEDADLLNFAEDNDTNVIFFIRKGDVFDNTNILRLFTLGRQLGEGGFGQVYLATMKTSMKLFAIKFLKHHKTNDIDYLFKEINLLLRLKNENIIKLHSYFSTEEGRIGLVMDYALGGTLKQYILSKGRLDENTARTILTQILRTVSYCHEEGIIHRDLKTDNILFQDPSYTRIKVIDFGISALLNTKSRAGSLAYLSPEVLSGIDSSSLPSVDIWAIGCMLYEMVTGTKMFQGKSNEEIKNKIIKRKVIFPKYLTLECINLIDALTTLNPSHRITIDQAISHPWVKNEKLHEICEITKSKGLLFNKRELMIKKRNRQKANMNEALTGLSMNLVTKVSNIKEDDFFYYNMSVLQKIPGYMKPIGHDRKQRMTVLRLKNFHTVSQINTTSNKKTDPTCLPLLNSAPLRSLPKAKFFKVKRVINLDISKIKNAIEV